MVATHLRAPPADRGERVIDRAPVHERAGGVEEKSLGDMRRLEHPPQVPGSVEQDRQSAGPLGEVIGGRAARDARIGDDSKASRRLRRPRARAFACSAGPGRGRRQSSREGIEPGQCLVRDRAGRGQEHHRRRSSSAATLVELP
jgi:hypothetical protein